MQNNVRSGCLNSVWLLLFSFCWSGVQAKEVPCDTTQPSANSFPLLEQECPIGKGLWGKQLPKDERAFFWIQCGVFKTAALSSLVTKLYPHISTSIQFKQDEESQAYRCLIGPYTDYTYAKTELTSIQKLADYTQAFLREVPMHDFLAVKKDKKEKSTISDSNTGTHQPLPNTFPVLEQDYPIGQGVWEKQFPKDERSFFWIQCGVFKKPTFLSHVNKLYPYISTRIHLKQDKESQAYRCLVGPYTDYVQAKMELVAIQKHVDFRQAFLRQVPLAALPQVEEKKITIGVSATVNGTKYIVPYFWDETIPFYTEYNLAWNRLRYDEARQMCQILNMRLATEQEWQQLLDSDAIQNDPWPVELPYWGEGQKGFFMNGNINTLKATSQLNILCVQES
ncbi:sporulation protein [Vibrio cincinnatiensis]|uniref:Sporulation related domain-containing protein n=1 Tax=Vibrio cincinnatiensis DSM 19608 TaxID=1123491 RepID=A0A1T4RF70_VIBCI|nr:hypothetical protein [Vibrio cincinnatiensis]SKA14680.1 hypothetical protein SAMN02745782_02611 [Vibrio cincinnatiensis DSM 19608]SUP50134.1 sporulation protein [Vibrio cincinnatiensis]